MTGEGQIRTRLDPGFIEAELQQLWQQIAGASDEDGRDVLRSSVLNLVACSDPDGETDQLMADLTGAGRSQPGRLILLLIREESSAEGFEARVSAHCQMQPGGREQLCGEVIRIVVHGEAVERASSVVAPLLLPDLPVFLWWRRDLDFDSALLRRLARSTDRLVIDSGRRPGEEDLQVAAMLLESPELTLSDLAWARLQVWRRALAGLYDSLLTRPALTSPARIRIGFGGTASLPSEAVYLIAWLASRLGWEPLSSLAESDWGYRLECRNRESRVAVELHRDAGEGLSQVQLFTETDLGVALVRHESHLETRIEYPGGRSGRQILPQSSPGEVELMAAELEILGKDRVFEEALACASRLMDGRNKIELDKA